MIISIRKIFFITSILLSLIVVPSTPAIAQHSMLNRNITITAINQPLYEVLNKIGRQSGIKFSYNPDDIAARRLVTIRAGNEPLSKVLQQIINNPELAYREMGNQVIIFKPSATQAGQAESRNGGLANDSKPDPPKQQSDPVVKPPKTDSVPQNRKEKNVADIARTDTIVRIDTIILRDTIHRFDTVIIEKQVPATPLANGSSKLKKKYSPYSLELSFTQLFGKATYTDPDNDHAELLKAINASESASLQNFNATMSLSYNLKKAGITAGISYSRYGELFDHEFLEQIGGYYRHDTVETYYTVTGADTNWYYITDSTWLNLDYKKYTYSGQNSARYLEFPLSLRYYPVKNDRFSWFLRGGITAGVLLGSKSMVIDPEEFKNVRVDAEKLNPVILSWTAGTGIEISLYENLAFTAEAAYRRQLTPLFRAYPLSKKYHLPGLKAGLCIKL